MSRCQQHKTVLGIKELNVVLAIDLPNCCDWTQMKNSKNNRVLRLVVETE